MNKMPSSVKSNNVSVSVLVPIYNVEKYLSQCLDSLASQTLADVEFICINDGSTDQSSKIIREYSKKDKRFKVLDKDNSGYGDSMNRGLAMARGKYIGIVESDDWAEPDMFEKLLGLAEANGAQAVKSNFYFYTSSGGGTDVKFDIVDPNEVGAIINPRVTPHVFKGMSTIWSGLYNRQFLINNDINFLPTPGASYQDTAFNFKVWAAATRVVYTSDAYLHYRIDNESSSVKSRSKVFCVCDEFNSIKKYLINKGLMEQLKPVYTQRKFDIYYWNLTRLDGQNLKDFAVRMSRDFIDDKENGYFDDSLCSDSEKRILDKVIVSGVSYVKRRNLRSSLAKIYRLLGRTIGSVNRSKIRRRRIINNLVDAAKNNEETIFSMQNNIYCVKHNNEYMGNNLDDIMVTIIVPVYNAAQYIEETLDSLTNQTLSNIEVVCIDDGSTDDSLVILKNKAKEDERIRVYHQKNQGVAVARNAGLDHARGKYIMWCDSDDKYEPNMCLEMCCIMECRNVEIAACSQNIIYDHIDRSLHKDTTEYLGQKYVGNQLINWTLITNVDVSLWNKIFRRDLIERNHIRFPNGLLFEDAYFCNVYMLNSRTIYFTDHRLYNYIRRPSSIMSTSFKKSKSSGDYLKIAVELYKFLKKNGLYDQYVDFFWVRFIQDCSYSYANQDRVGKSETKKMIRSFIDGHLNDFKKASPSTQRAVLEMLQKLSFRRIIRQTVRITGGILDRVSSRHRQKTKMVGLSNQVATQARYIEYITRSGGLLGE